MSISPQALYEEFANDPGGYGYKIGDGVSFEDKQTQINLVRVEIQIQRKAQDTPIGPGEVTEPVPIQVIRDSIDPDEYELNCFPQSGDDEIIIAQHEAYRDWIHLLFGGTDGLSNFAFTELAKGQILQLFKAANWPLTRQNLIDLQYRDGTRAEELFGNPPAPVVRNDMLAAEQYAVSNGLTSLYE